MSNRSRSSKAVMPMRFEADDMDWVMGELGHAFSEVAKWPNTLLHQLEPKLCVEALQFFAGWHDGLLALYQANQPSWDELRALFPDRPMRLVKGRWQR